MKTLEKPQPPKRVVVVEDINFRVLATANAMHRACPVAIGFLLGYIIGVLK